MGLLWQQPVLRTQSLSKLPSQGGGVFTLETTAHNPLYNHRCRLLIINNMDQLRATINTASMLDSILSHIHAQPMQPVKATSQKHNRVSLATKAVGSIITHQLHRYIFAMGQGSSIGRFVILRTK